MRRLKQFNSTAIARRNVTYHYDVDPRIYRLFLDSGLNYSCAYFQSPNMNLEEAQLAKLRHLAVKLNLKSSHKVLDIGSGWGSLAIYLAKHFDVAVKGVTLSEEQLKVSRQRALREGVENRVHFEIQDYRELNEVFDRIVSVGMFEHVGVGQYPVYMDTIKRLLAEDGVALIHSIGRFEGPGATNPFIERFIFPGGYIPALSEVVPVVESSGLLLTDVEIWRLHYAETLRIWRQRFMASRDEASDIMGEEFCRMWEFYLAGSEATFRFDGMMVFQIQLCRDQETLSLTRDYMFDREDELKASAVNF